MRKKSMSKAILPLIMAGALIPPSSSAAYSSEIPEFFYPTWELPNKDAARFVRPGETVKLQMPGFLLNDDGSTDFSITLKSSDPSGISCSEDGSFTALEEGIYEIRFHFIRESNDPEDVLHPVANETPLIVFASENEFVFRLYNPNTGEHVYTADGQERRYLIDRGWKDEDVAWIAPKQSDQPVHRLYNPVAGDHHYTKDENEVTALRRIGWNDEGICFYSSGDDTNPVWRAYNSNAQSGAHHFTRSELEKDFLVCQGWKDEAIGWHALDELPMRGIVTIHPDPAYPNEDGKQPEPGGNIPASSKL